LTDGYLRVARVLHGTTAEGPGLRTAVWFQGCSIQCKGCINPHLFNPRGGTDSSVTEIVHQAVRAGVEGLTLIGGEPFDQPDAGAALAGAAQDRGLGIMAFSGYEYELLVDGPYQARYAETRRALVGSTNQRFIHLTDRYQTYRPEIVANRVDVRVLPDGSIEVAGFLDTPGLSALAGSTGTRRTIRRT
jgi:anaerobic ribonucleoside-triphosphate reductase activating protein